MKTILHDLHLRTALFDLYLALFTTFKKNPGVFTKADATRMLTSLMGSRPWSWRVIGITPDALEVFAANNFQRVAGLVHRGHRNDRASTAQMLLLERTTPMPIDDFFETFLLRDQTVLMTKKQNKHRPRGVFPDFIDISSDEEVFPCGTLVGWRHRKAEVEYLKNLYTSRHIVTSGRTMESQS